MTSSGRKASSGPRSPAARTSWRAPGVKFDSSSTPNCRSCGSSPPIASVHAVTAEQQRAFHDHWYRPDAAFLVIVGDVDPAATVKAIETAFGSWARPAAPLPPRPVIAFQPRSPDATVIADPALPDTLALSVAEPRPAPVPSVATRRDSLDRVRLHATGLTTLTREQVKALAAQVFSAPAVTMPVLPRP